MGAEIHHLPGTFNPAAAQGNTEDPKVSLRDALDAPLRDVAIVGRAIDGEMMVWGSVDADSAIGLLMRGAHWLSAREQVSAPHNDDPVGESA